jgi:hypothetical protein
MDVNPEQPEPSEIDPRTRLRIVSVELNEATAEFYKARHDVLYRRLRAVPARRHLPAWGAALIVGAIGAVFGAIPALLVRGDNLLFVFVAVCAAYTILSPATLLLLADRDNEDDSNRLAIREAALAQAIAHREQTRQRVASLYEQQTSARLALRPSANPGEQQTQGFDGPVDGSDG